MITNCIDISVLYEVFNAKAAFLYYKNLYFKIISRNIRSVHSALLSFYLHNRSSEQTIHGVFDPIAVFEWRIRFKETSPTFLTECRGSLLGSVLDYQRESRWFDFQRRPFVRLCGLLYVDKQATIKALNTNIQVVRSDLQENCGQKLK